MILKAQDYINTINKEIEWSENKENQKTNNITDEQVEWFVKGLKQAKILIQNMQVLREL
jgi:hypothetical protein